MGSRRAAERTAALEFPQIPDRPRRPRGRRVSRTGRADRHARHHCGRAPARRLAQGDQLSIVAHFRFEGCAIVSADGMLARTSGAHPVELTIEADQRFFAEKLDAAAVIVHGRNSHEGQPNSANRKRVIATRKVLGVEADPTCPTRCSESCNHGLRGCSRRARRAPRSRRRHRRHRDFRPVPRSLRCVLADSGAAGEVRHGRAGVLGVRRQARRMCCAGTGCGRRKCGCWMQNET